VSCGHIDLDPHCWACYPDSARAALLAAATECANRHAVLDFPLYDRVGIWLVEEASSSYADTWEEISHGARLVAAEILGVEL
jgi:hypothetical protein